MNQIYVQHIVFPGQFWWTVDGGRRMKKKRPVPSGRIACHARGQTQGAKKPARRQQLTERISKYESPAEFQLPTSFISHN